MTYPKEVIAKLIELGLAKDTDQSKDAGKAAIKAFIAEKNIDMVAIQAEVVPAAKPVQAKVVDSIQASNDERALNLERQAAIEALEISAEIKAKAIKENWSAEKAELEGIRASRAKAPGVIVKKHENVNANVLQASILLKSGYPVAKLEKKFDAQTLDFADLNRSVSLKGLIQVCCELEGKNVPSINASPDMWVNAAFSTASVSGILSNVANKMLEMGFETSEDAAAIMKICKERSLNDLKTNTMYRMFTGGKLPVVPGGGPVQFDSLVEGSSTIQAETHAKLIGITRAMMINDDLNAFTEIAQKMGIDAFEQFADDGVALIEDAGSFFHADNGNVDTGAEIPSVAGYNAMRLLFAAFTESLTSTKLIGAKPQMVVVPSALFTSAQSMFVSQNLIASGVGSTAAYVGEANPFAGNYEVVEITRLSAAAEWYGLANPARIPAFNVGFLNGQKSPTVEEVAVAPEYLGKAWRMIWDYGFALGDYQGAVKMS